MILSYYTLRALANEWHEILQGGLVQDVYTQARAELTLQVGGADLACSLHVGLSGPQRHVFRREGYNRARRNTVSVLEDARNERVVSVSTPDRDRHLFVDFASGLRLHVVLFGPRPNVFLVREGAVLDAFLRADSYRDKPAPAPRPAARPTEPDEFRSRWNFAASSASVALSRAVVLFDRTLANEALWRAGVDPEGTAEIADEAIDRCFLHVQKIEEQLASPEPHIYRQEHTPVVFSLIRLDHPPADEAASFETVDRAVGVYVRARLGADRFAASYDPLRQLLENALARTGRSVSGMRSELSSESRADKYERWGHLLMAVAHEVPQGVEAWVTHDLYEPGTEIAIPLDPELKAIENAERYYEKARRTRQAREHAARRLQELEDLLSELQAAREELGDVSDLKEIREFRERHKRLLARSSGGGAATDGETGFRRYTVHGGYEVWVGRNARQNDELTFQHAAKHDVWMHARGVAGSHAVLRLPGRDMNLPRRTLQEAAGIAAYHSKAAGSDLVPVMHTARKYVRKPKNAPPGAVIVEREEMIIVPPELPHSR